MLTLTSTKKSSWKKDFHKRCWLWRDVSPTIKLVILQTLFPLVAQNGHKFHENGCEYYFHGWWLETKFLHDSNTIFFFVKGIEQKRLLTLKSIYELKQPSWALYENLIEHLLILNFKHFTLDDVTLFFKNVLINVIYLVVYVDDL